MITLPDGKICNNLPEQVAKNAKDILEIAAQWQPYKEELEADFVILNGIIEDMSAAAVAALAGQDVSVNKLYISTPSYVKDFTAPEVTNFSLLNSFCRFEVIANMLHIVFCARYQNNDADNAQQFKLGNFSVSGIDSEIGSHVYDLGGKKLSEAPAAGSLSSVIRQINAGVSVYGQNVYSHSVGMIHYGTNVVRFEHGTSASVNPNNVVVITFEAHLTLI